MNWKEHTVIDSAVLTGKPIIKDIRLAVEFIINLLAHDWTESKILRKYPGLSMRYSSVYDVCERFTQDRKGLFCRDFSGSRLMRLLANENIPLSLR